MGRKRKRMGLQRLLIVPYGIETVTCAGLDKPSFLLIVPYGIETHRTNRLAQLLTLLIVPYGIETPLQSM